MVHEVEFTVFSRSSMMNESPRAVLVNLSG